MQMHSLPPAFRRSVQQHECFERTVLSCVAPTKLFLPCLIYGELPSGVVVVELRGRSRTDGNWKGEIRSALHPRSWCM